jgi:hypothetical protein
MGDRCDGGDRGKLLATGGFEPRRLRVEELLPQGPAGTLTPRGSGIIGRCPHVRRGHGPGALQLLIPQSEAADGLAQRVAGFMRRSAEDRAFSSQPSQSKSCIMSEKTFVDRV